ncbi:adenylate/guanylate cyclase domain-containing protein [Microvirga pakistanensis]|uniref:adenylate/guanylate cyclase domain-containing protein n=1 Tax=Microvirga pakistanensis TaxID=1682650 RepID=UPI001069167D|nr:adenylate/guanylate cyclase domain-containing protein [Microvirga pakistanensis]
MSQTTSQSAVIAVIMLVCLSAGLAYDRFMGANGPLISIIYALSMGAPLAAYELGALLPKWRYRLRRMPILVSVPLAEITYLALVCAGHFAAGSSLWGVGLLSDGFTAAAIPSVGVLVYALVVSAVIVSIIKVRDLLGSEVLVNLLVGRYHRPVSEERVFLFVDIVGSTGFAEAHGALRAQELLAAFFAVLADPVATCGGAIDDYVGDMAIVSWPLSRGVERGRCVQCIFAIQDALAQDAQWWIRRFGCLPRFRAALHGGQIVTAEVGVDRHKITYFGDTINTTARLEALCREIGADVLISADLLSRLEDLPPHIHVRALGEYTIRGRGKPVVVSALERRILEQVAA